MAAETTAPRIVHSLWVMSAVSLILMCLRFLCKRRYGKQFGVDDVILAASWIFLLLYTVLTIASTTHGIGSHVVDIPLDDFKAAVKVLYAGEFFAIIAVAVSKSSFAVTLLRLATQPWQRYVLWYIIGSVNVVMWLCGLFQYIQCSPVNKLWDLEVPGTCWDPMIQVRYAIFAGSYSAAMDFALALVPWVLMWNIQMGRREKLGVSVAMSLGVLAGIAATVKTSYLNDIARSTDFTYMAANLLIWAGCETAVTIMAASIPYYRLAFKDIAKKSKSRLQQSGYKLSDTSGTRRLASKGHHGTKTSRSRAACTVVVESAQQNWDSWSDKELVKDSKEPGNAGILRIQKVSVNYEDADLEDNKSDCGTFGGK